MLPVVRTEICAIPSRVREESRDGGGGSRAFAGAIPPKEWPMVGETRLDAGQFSDSILCEPLYIPRHCSRSWLETHSTKKVGGGPHPSHTVRTRSQLLRIPPGIAIDRVGKDGEALPSHPGPIFVLDSPRTKRAKPHTEYAKKAWTTRLETSERLAPAAVVDERQNVPLITSPDFH